MVFYFSLYLSLGIILSILGNTRNYLALHVLAIYLNIIPFWTPYIGSDMARFAGFPIAIIPSFLLMCSQLVTQNKHYISISDLFLFLGLIFISLISSVINFIAFRDILNLLLFIFMLYYILTARDVDALLYISQMTRFVIIGLPFFILLSLVLRNYFFHFAQNGNPFFLMNRNLAIYFILGIYFIIRELKISGNFLTVLLNIVFTLIFLILGSRAGLIGFFVLLAIFNPKSLARNVVSFFSAVLCIYLVYNLFDFTFLDRYVRLLRTVYILSTYGIDANLQELGGEFKRVELLRVAIAIIHDNFLFGIGPGNGTYIQSIREYSSTSELRKPHNQFISIFAEIGFFGWVLFFMLLASTKRLNKLRLLVFVLWLMGQYFIVPTIWYFAKIRIKNV